MSHLTHKDLPWGHVRISIDNSTPYFNCVVFVDDEPVCKLATNGIRVEKDTKDRASFTVRFYQNYDEKETIELVSVKIDN